MAWPLTAIIRTYSSLMKIYSADLNEIQSRVVDLHRDRTMILLNAVSAMDISSSEPAWVFFDANPEHGWVNQHPPAGETQLTFDIELPHGSIIKQIDIKWYNSHSNPKKPICAFYSVDPNFDSDSTAPGAPTLLASMAAVTDIPAAEWGARSMTSLAQTVSTGMRYFVVCDANQITDKIAGLQITYQPLTPT